MPCLSLIDGAGLLYFEKYFKPPVKKNIICIPLCDGVHFQGYIVNTKKHKIIHIDGAGLLYFEKYFKPPVKKNIICIPLCDGVHFQGYIVNTKEHKIIHIDSLRWDQPKNPTSIQIAKMLFENSQPTFESLFSERK